VWPGPPLARLHLFICAGWSGVFLIPPIGTDYASENAESENSRLF